MATAAKLPLAKPLALAGLALGVCLSAAASAGSLPDGTPAPPPQKGVNIGNGPKAPATDEPIERLQMSSDLLAFGRKKQDPLVLIVAARILKALGGSEVDLKPETRTTAPDAQKPGQPMTADSLLIEARDLAKGDKIISLLVDETAGMGAASGGGERKTHQDTVQPGGTDVYRVVFDGGQLAEAGIAGDGDSDLDLYVYDNNDNLVCRSAGSSDREYCRWWPRWTGPFRIEVQNLGGVPSFYRVATN
jgi:hypothetical protein